MFSKRQLLALMAAACVTASSAFPAFSQDRRVTIINNTDFTIVRFHGSNQGTDSWEEDILGRNVLKPQAKLKINFDDGTGFCRFDFRAVFNDGDVLVQNDINVCEIGSFTYN